jgi:hypothetical protein
MQPQCALRSFQPSAIGESTMKIRLLTPIALLAASPSVFAADAPKKPPAAPKEAAAKPAETGRDWSRIDTDKDGLVSPEEMEKFLADNPGPLKK